MTILLITHQRFNLFLHFVNLDREYDGYFFINLFFLFVGDVAAYFFENLLP